MLNTIYCGVLDSYEDSICCSSLAYSEETASEACGGAVPGSTVVDSGGVRSSPHVNGHDKITMVKTDKRNRNNFTSHPSMVTITIPACYVFIRGCHKSIHVHACDYPAQGTLSKEGKQEYTV